MNHYEPQVSKTRKNLDSEVVSVHGRDLCGKCNSLCCSKCHVCSLEFLGAVRSCMELFCHGILISIISSILHHLHSRLDVMMAPNFMETVAARGEHLSEAQCDVATASAKVQGSRLCLLEFIVTYSRYSDHWPRRKGLEDLRALYPEVIQEVLQCRVPFPLMRGELTYLTWLVASNDCNY